MEIGGARASDAESGYFFMFRLSEGSPRAISARDKSDPFLQVQTLCPSGLIAYLPARTATILGMRNMTEGRPASLILKFSLPLLAETFLQQMYNFVDSLVVGNFVGKEALAAVGGTAILSFLLSRSSPGSPSA